VVFAIVIDETVGVVHPVLRWGVVVLRPVLFLVGLRMGGGYCADGRGQQSDALSHLVGGRDEELRCRMACLLSSRFHDMFIRSHSTVVFVFSKAMLQPDIWFPSSAMFNHVSDRIELTVLESVVERVRRHADPLL
jgi:hypothetical protein